MNRRLLLIIALSSIGFAQTTTPAGSEKTQPKSGQTTPPAAPSTPTSGAQEKNQTPNPPGQSSTTSNPGQTATPPPATPSKPPHRTPPAAKSQEEFNAFQQVANISDPAAQEKASDDFAQKFPQSDLRPLLYSNLMRRYQSANDSDKTLE